MANKNVVVKEEKELANEEWYQALVDDCKTIKVELGVRAAMAIFEHHYKLGQRIYSGNSKMKRDNVYGKKIISSVANDIGIAPVTLYQFVQCYKTEEEKGNDTFEKFEASLPKNIVWSRYVKEKLGVRSEKSKEKSSYKVDEICNTLKKFFYEDLGYLDEEKIDKLIEQFKERLVTDKD